MTCISYPNCREVSTSPNTNIEVNGRPVAHDDTEEENQLAILMLSLTHLATFANRCKYM